MQLEHNLPPARLLSYMHEKYTIKTVCTNGLPVDDVQNI